VAYGGTSTAAPAFAGILAVVQQSTGGRLGQAAKNLYDLYNGPVGSSIFHDTTVGNNSVPCTMGTPDCMLNTAGNYYLSGYDTTTGYDLATGLGSVDIRSLVDNWNSSTGAAAPTITATPSMTTFSASTPITVSVSLTGTDGTPSGTVTITSGNFTAQNAVSSTDGTALISIPANSLTVGTDTLTVSYSGDVNYGAATTTATVTVTGLTPAMTVVPSATTLSVNTALTVTATVTGAGPTPTGTVALTGAFTVKAQTLSDGAFTFSIPANSLSTGAQTFTVSYSGDTNYAPITGTATVTVTGSTATFTLAAGASSPASVAAGATAVANITVATPNGYTGQITLACAQTSGPANTAVDTPTCEFNPALSFTSASVGIPFSVLTFAPIASAALTAPGSTGKGRGSSWAGAGSGAVLALLVFFGIPARRRKWLSMVGLFIAMAVLGSLVACGGGGTPQAKTPQNPGTAAGTYTYTVTATGAPAPASAPASVTFTVTVTN
jgi:hypothetical protein